MIHGLMILSATVISNLERNQVPIMHIIVSIILTDMIFPTCRLNGVQQENKAGLNVQNSSRMTSGIAGMAIISMSSVPTKLFFYNPGMLPGFFYYFSHLE